MHYCKFLTTVLLSMTAGLLATIPAAAQTCTTTWPYLYPDFQDGTVYMSGGRSQHLKFNIHMLRTTLHYIELGMIKEAYPRDIDSIRIGNDLFRYVNGVPMRVAAAGTSGPAQKKRNVRSPFFILSSVFLSRAYWVPCRR